MKVKDKTDLMLEIKAVIRANNDLMHQWENGHLSFGKMAELLSVSIIKRLTEIGFITSESGCNSSCKESEEGNE